MSKLHRQTEEWRYEIHDFNGGERYMTQNEEVVLEAFVDFLNAVDAGVCAARETIKKAKGLSATAQEGTWNPNAIKWETKEGAKGPYEKSTDFDNLQHKAMLRDLADHDGKLRREGYFYWVFQDGNTVGRKKK